MFNNNADSYEMIHALKTAGGTPTLSVDVGAGQSCMYLLANQMCHRLALDTAGSRNLMTALGVMTFRMPESTRTCLLVSNYMSSYEALRTLGGQDKETVQAILSSGSMISLLSDLLLAAACDETQRTLHVIVPAGCDSIREFKKKLGSLLMQFENEKHPLFAGRFDNYTMLEGEYSPLYQNFKAPPTEWNRQFDNRYTFRELMEMYTQALMRRAAVINPALFYSLHYHESAADSDRLAGFLKKFVIAGSEQSQHIKNENAHSFRMVAGCPASQDWTNHLEAYSKSLRKACAGTGLHTQSDGEMGFGTFTRMGRGLWGFLGSLLHTENGIEVFPEPCAAILPHVTGNDGGESLSLNRGVAVCDSGGLTNDWCLMYYGKRSAWRFSCSSAAFGGAQIERNMLFLLRRMARLQREEQGLDTEFDLQEMASHLLSLRMEKERYYENGRKDGPRSLTFRLANGEKHTQSYRIGELVTQALNIPYRAIFENADAQEKSILQRAREFAQEAFRRFCIATGADQSFCFDTLIFTGGTSNVTELRTAIESLMPCRHVISAADVSGSVGNGLALTFSQAELQGIRRKIENDCDLSDEAVEISSVMLAQAEYYLPSAFAAAVDACLRTSGTCYMKDLSEKVIDRLLGNAAFQDEINRAVRAFADKGCEKVGAAANRYLPAAFPGRIPPLRVETKSISVYSENATRSIVQGVVEQLDVRDTATKIKDKAVDILKVTGKGMRRQHIPIVGKMYNMGGGAQRDLEKLGRKRIADAKEEELSAARLEGIKKTMSKSSFSRDNLAAAVEEAFGSGASRSAAESIKSDLIHAVTGYLTMNRFDVDKTETEIN